ncbi:MAG: DMT family transporter [Hyphomonadaceae bacterium]
MSEAAANQPQKAPEQAPAQAARLAPFDVALLLGIGAAWAVNSLLTKIAVADMPPLLFCAIRFLIVAVLLIPYVRRPPAGWGVLIAIVLLTGSLHFGFQNVGLALAHDLSPMVIAMQLWIPASIVFATIFLRERAGPWRILGVGVSFAGIVVLAADPTVFAQVGALALISFGAACYGGGAVIVRRAPKMHPLGYQAWIGIISAPLLFAISGATETGHWQAVRDASWFVWFAIAFAALAGSIGGNAIMFHLAQRYELSRTTPFLFVSPVLAMGLGVVILGDPMPPQLLIGAALTLVGVGLVAMADRLVSRP